MTGAIAAHKQKRLEILRSAHAVDGLFSAVRFAEKLVATWGQDDQITAALHTAMVVDYSRAFEERPIYPHRHLRKDEAFKAELHRQLLNMRHKLIAHSDRSYTVNELGIVVAKIQSGGLSFAIPQKAVVRLSTLQSITSKDLAEAYFSHVRAAAHGSLNDIHRQMHEYLRARALDQTALEADEPKPGDKRMGQVHEIGPLKAGEGFIMPTTEQLVPPMENPKLTIGLDGLQYRTTGLEAGLYGNIEVKLPNGSTITLTITQKQQSENPQ